MNTTDERYLCDMFIDDVKGTLGKPSSWAGWSEDQGTVIICSLENPTKYEYLDAIGTPVTRFPNATTIGRQAFDGCMELTSISLPKATTIGSYAFNGCTNLTSVDLPVATTIGSSAFEGCRNLTSITLPAATTIDSSAFMSCTKLTSINLPLVESIHSAFNECTSLTSISLPKATTIDGTFYGCTSLTSVDLPVATTIGGQAFHGCTSITSIDLPAATAIGPNVFAGCTNLNAVILRTTETVCNIDPTSFVIETDESGNPTVLNDNFYIPASMFDAYRAAYEPVFEQFGFAGMFDIGFHKIEDYPEICGEVK